MSQDWQIDKNYADKSLTEVKRIIGGALIGAAPIEEDRERNTDLIVLKMEAVRIACRIRRPKFYDSPQYREEFTIRSGRPNGIKTELAKVIEGWGDYFFYGFAGEEALQAWLLGDLRVFRLWFNQRLRTDKGKCPGTTMRNHDGSSDFMVFKISELPPEFIVDRFAGLVPAVSEEW